MPAASPPKQNLMRYEPRGAARQLLTGPLCRSPEILIEGPARTGKTRGVLEKFNAYLCRYAGARGLMVRKTKASLGETVLQTWEEHVLPDNPALYPVKGDVKRENRRVYRYPSGSIAVVAGLDNPDRFMSSEYDIIVVFEGTETNLDDLEKLTSRLSNQAAGTPYKQIIVDCNPGAPSHWLNKRAGVDGAPGQMERLLSRHIDNPAYWNPTAPKTPEDVPDDPDVPENNLTGNWTPEGRRYVLGTLRRGLSGARRLRLGFGRWSQAEGVVYDSYDTARNILTAANAPRNMLVTVEGGEAKLHIPGSWRRIRSIDFGFTDPFVCQWWAIDGDGRMYLYRELYATKKLTEDWAAEIVKLSAGERIEATVADWDAQERATLNRHGVPTERAMKAIKPGVQAVESRLRPAGDGNARLFILYDALVAADAELKRASKPTSSLSEIESYSWLVTKDGKNTKEVPEDKDNHGMDAMRYAVAYIDRINQAKPMEADAWRQVFSRPDDPEDDELEHDADQTRRRGLTLLP